MNNKEKVIGEIQQAHKELKNVLQSLRPSQLTEVKITEEWNIKDVISHLAAWNWEVNDEIDRVLTNHATWPKRYESGRGEDEFNKIQVEKRKGKTIDEIIQEWEDSYRALIEKLTSLTEEQWIHKSGNQKWTEGKLKGKSVTVFSLFDYEYEGKSHEAGHTNQIIKHFTK